MATINDYKILNAKCLKYFDLLQKETHKDCSKLDNTQKCRYGFYLYMLESLCEKSDVSEILDLLTDQEFNSFFFDIRDQDFGIDAIYIDNETNYINLFNFKYRKEFNKDKEQSRTESFASTKFVNAIISEKSEGLQGKIKNSVEEIIEKFHSDEIWKMRLFVVSNENIELDAEYPEFIQLKDLYELEIVPIGLDSIAKMMSLRPQPVNAKIHIDKEALFSFSESSLSSSRSYILRLSAIDLLRITCSNEQYRNQYNMEDTSVLNDTEMDYNVLFDNVRGFVTKSKYNENMMETIKEEPSRFFMYNNGLTITAKSIDSQPTNANKKLLLTISDFQIVNGGQTLRTLHEFKKKNPDNLERYLSQCELLIRLFKQNPEDEAFNKIAEYTNSQNAISNKDLKSLSSEQILIEQYLSNNNIIYARKSGDLGIDAKKDYQYKISMEKMAQILIAIKGYPQKSSNNKKQLFDKYYKDIFDKANLEIEKTPDYVLMFYKIKSEYENSQFEATDQKIFYCLYLIFACGVVPKKAIELLESTISSYVPASGKVTTPARMLIQVGFKSYLDSKL